MTKHELRSVSESRAPSRVRATKATNGGSTNRPPSYMSRKELAWELSISESTVDELARRGVIPPPVKLTPGCVRWWWPGVESAIANVAGPAGDGDAYMTGAINAIA
jgi:predicted DNA-binding transcriptional regulator AlpA